MNDKSFDMAHVLGGDFHIYVYHFVRFPPSNFMRKKLPFSLFKQMYQFEGRQDRIIRDERAHRQFCSFSTFLVFLLIPPHPRRKTAARPQLFWNSRPNENEMIFSRAAAWLSLLTSDWTLKVQFTLFVELWTNTGRPMVLNESKNLLRLVFAEARPNDKVSAALIDDSVFI